jgi:hypothetical protein
MKNKFNTSLHNTSESLRALHLEKGKFVAIIDMTNVSIFSSRPSIRVILDAVALIKYAYPNRLATLYVVNAGYIFSAIWKFIEPTLSQTSMGKMVFLSNIEEARRVLPLELGVETLEEEYGGLASQKDFDTWEYIQRNGAF